MNVYTILGAALLNEKIRDLLFENPLKAAARLGIVLIEAEVKVLQEITAGGENTKKLLASVENKVGCPIKPCAYQLACEEELVKTGKQAA